MPDLTFQQQLWLTIVDKAVLASVLVGVGYWANRLLESHKTKEALRAKLAEQRVPRIKAEIEKLQELRYRASRLVGGAFAAAQLAIAPREANGVKGSSATLDLRGAGLYDGPLGVEFKKAFEGRSDELLSLLQEIEVASDLVDKERFWLGKEVSSLVLGEYAGLGLRLQIPALAFHWMRVPDRSSVVGGFPLRVKKWFGRRLLLSAVKSDAELEAIDVDRALDFVTRRPG